MFEHVPPTFPRLFRVCFTLWCIAWPLLLYWGALHEQVVLSAVAVSVLVFTPYVIRHLAHVNYLVAQKLHRMTCLDLESTIEKLGQRHQFEIHEAAARELEILADSLDEAPPDVVIAPRSLARGINLRVQALRKTAPNPPEFDLEQLTVHDPDD